MAAEAKRGCGYRKVGGLYLVCDGGGISCCRLPIPLTVCPCCGEGIKQARGWVWVDPRKLLPAAPCVAGAPENAGKFGLAQMACPAMDPAHFGERAGLVWIGKQFYPSTAHFTHEAARQGISRRVKSMPAGFKLGESCVLLAHPEACTDRENKISGVFMIFRPQRLEKIVTQSQFDADAMMTAETSQRLKDEKRGITWVAVPDDDADHQGSVYDKDGGE